MRALALVIVFTSVARAAPLVIDAMPSPDAGAAREDVPAGATCRIGSNHLPLQRNYGEVVFASDGKIYVEGLGSWTKLDPTSGKKLDEFNIASVTSGISPSGSCVAVLAGDARARVDLFQFPARKAVAHHQFPEDKYSNLIPADDCSTAIQKQGYNSACVATFGAGLEPQGELCVGLELTASTISADGKRVALVPSRMNKTSYDGDGVHVFDLASKRELALVKRTGRQLGSAVALSNNGELVAFVDGETVRIVRVASNANVSTFALPLRFRAHSLVFAPSGKRLAIAMEEHEKRLAVIEVATGAPLFTQRNLPELGNARFRDDEVLAYAVGAGIRVVSATTGEDRVARGRLFKISSRAMSPDGERAVVASMGHLSVWSAHDCSLIRDIPGVPELTQVLVTPNGKLAIGYTNDGMVRVDLATGVQAALAFSHRHRDSVAITTDGKLALVGAEVDDRNQQVLVIDIAAMKVVQAIPLPKVASIGALIVSPTDKHVRAVGPGGVANGDTPTGGTSVIELEPESGAIVKRFQIDGAEQDYVGAVLERGASIAINGQRFDPSGKPLPGLAAWLREASSDGATLLWRGKQGAFVWPADKPLPSEPRGTMTEIGWSVVGAGVMMSCTEQTCLVAR